MNRKNIVKHTIKSRDCKTKYNSEWMRSDFDEKMSAELTKITRQVDACVDLKIKRNRHNSPAGSSLNLIFSQNLIF